MKMSSGYFERSTTKTLFIYLPTFSHCLHFITAMRTAYPFYDTFPIAVLLNEKSPVDFMNEVPPKALAPSQYVLTLLF